MGMGVSLTTRRPGPVWTIHHKTSMFKGAHGYPDEGYLDRVEEELKERGIGELRETLLKEEPFVVKVGKSKSRPWYSFGRNKGK
jgi:hypothetical protein